MVRERTIPLTGDERFIRRFEDLASCLRGLDEETGVIGDRHSRRPARTALTLISTLRNYEMPSRNDISAACYSLLRSRVDCRARRVFSRQRHTEIRAVIGLLLARMKCVMSVMLFKNQLEYRGCGRAFGFLKQTGIR